MTKDPHRAKKIRVCIVRHSFYPSELNVRREAQALVGEEFDVSVICLRGEKESANETIDGVRVYRMPIGHKRGRIGRYIFEYNAFFILASIKLFLLHIRRRFHAVQVNTMPDALVFTALIPKLTGAKIVLHMHEPVPELFATMFTGWYVPAVICVLKWVEKISLKFADRVLTVTRDMRDNFGRRGADINRITVIVNVPDDDIFLPEKFNHLADRIEHAKKEERRKGIFRVFCHGAIEKRYGIDLIIKAVAHVKERVPGVRFRFLGKGSYIGEVLDLAAELKVADNVNYLGFVPFENMVEEILTADVGIVPMKKNPYSVLVHTNKMFEYLALGLPVIASRLDAVASYFPDDSLLYFEPGNWEDLAEKLFHSFAHPDELARRTAEASNVYETYRWSRERKKYIGVYHALLKEDMVPKSLR